MALATMKARRADLGRAKRYLGYERHFKLQDALKDLADWIQRCLA
jgi:nucleoside-diphosphate-sugar epimerase